LKVSTFQIGLLVLEKIFSNINIYVNMVFPSVASPDPGNHDVNNSDSYYIAKLSCKYELFWLSGFGEDF
jgi:hypothetical protein